MNIFTLRDKAFAFLALCGLVLALEFGAWRDVQPVYALDNGLKFTNTFGAEMTNHPIWGYVWLARGEVPNYCKTVIVASDAPTVDVNPATWQCTVLDRWRDATAVRSATGVSSGYTMLTNTTDATCTAAAPACVNITGLSVSVSHTEVPGHPVATASTGTPGVGTPHGLNVGDRIQYTGTPTTMNVPKTVDNGVVFAVPSTTTFKYISKANRDGTFQNLSSTSNYTTAVITNKIDPNAGDTDCVITAPNHDVLIGETMVFTGLAAAGITASSSTMVARAITRDKIVANGTCTGTYNGGTVTFTAPARGSVQQAFWATKTRIPNAGNVRVYFTNSTTPCSSGNQAACDAAGFNETSMLAASWNFKIRATFDVKTGTGTAGTSTMEADARTMLTAGDFNVPSYCGNRIYARGPVLTFAIVEFGCAGATTPSESGYDFGKQILAGGNFPNGLNGSAGLQDVSVSSTANLEAGMIIWTSGETIQVNSVNTGASTVNITRALTGTPTVRANGYRFGILAYQDATSDASIQLHPRYDLIFINGWSGVRARVVIQNDYYEKMSSISYSLAVQTGSPTPTDRLTFGRFKHLINSRISFILYDGANAEYFCGVGSSGTDPDNCATTGGGTRTRRFLTDLNAAYKGYAKNIHDLRHYASPEGLSQSATGFAGSDKGAISTILGKGTWGVQPNSASTSPVIDGQGEQEAYMFTDVHTKCLLNPNVNCYEITYGVSVPGGAGNVGVQDHEPWHHRSVDNSVPRYVMPGFAADADRSFGRYLSLFDMPFFQAKLSTQGSSGGSYAPWDRAATNCAASPPSDLPQDSTNPDSKFWPCYYFYVDGWQFDNTHINDWSAYAYLETGDPYYLDLIQSLTAWTLGWEPNTRNLGRSWTTELSGAPTITATEPRQGGGWLRAALNSATYTPNEPQFGFTTPSVLVYYHQEILWNSALIREGFLNITDGWNSILYPGFSTTCPDGQSMSRWKWGKCGFAALWTGDPPVFVSELPNALYLLGKYNAGCGGTEPWINCSFTPTPAPAGMWYYHHGVNHWAKAAKISLPMFRYARAKWADTLFSLWQPGGALAPPSVWNRWLNDLYQGPHGYTNGNWIQTLAEGFSHMKDTWPPAESKFDQDFDHWGNISNSTTNPIGYVAQQQAAIAASSDLRFTIAGTRDGCPVTTPIGSATCNYDNAWNFLATNFTDTYGSQRWNEYPKFIHLPSGDPIDLSCSKTGTTTASCTYTAPLMSDGCTYAYTTSTFTDSRDATDSAASGTISLTGLPTTGTVTTRVTCGPRISNVIAGSGRAYSAVSMDGGVTPPTTEARMPGGRLRGRAVLR